MQDTLSIQQPWPWLITRPDLQDTARSEAHKLGLIKDVENRTWPTRKKGEILIHAGKKFDTTGYFWVKDNFPQIQMPELQQFQRGGIVGKARIINCVDELFENPWFFGPYGFMLRQAEAVPFMACRGQLGFFKVDYKEAV